MIHKTYTTIDLIIWNVILIAAFTGIACVFPDEAEAKRTGVPGRRGGGGTRAVPAMVY